MKITRSQLKQIVEEETRSMFEQKDLGEAFAGTGYKAKAAARRAQAGLGRFVGAKTWSAEKQEQARVAMVRAQVMKAYEILSSSYEGLFDALNKMEILDEEPILQRAVSELGDGAAKLAAMKDRIKQMERGVAPENVSEGLGAFLESYYFKEIILEEIQLMIENKDLNEGWKEKVKGLALKGASKVTSGSWSADLRAAAEAELEKDKILKIYEILLNHWNRLEGRLQKAGLTDATYVVKAISPFKTALTNYYRKTGKALEDMKKAQAAAEKEREREEKASEEEPEEEVDVADGEGAELLAAAEEADEKMGY